MIFLSFSMDFIGFHIISKDFQRFQRILTDFEAIHRFQGILPHFREQNGF